MKTSNSKFLSSLKQEPIKKDDNRLYFINSPKSRQLGRELEEGINPLKTFLKKWPWFYNFLQILFTPAYSPVGGLAPKEAISRAFKKENLADKIILNLGSGTKRILPEVINCDIYPFKNVDLVADIRELPFKDGLVDMVIVDSVLEHVSKAEWALKEIKRIIKPRGYVYINVPFLYPFHASPNDYKRWTIEGLKSDFDEFKPIKVGMRGGPMAALQGVLMHIFALLLSFGMEKLYLFWSQFFMILLSPLKLLDVIFRFLPWSDEAASMIYLFGRKNNGKRVV